MAVCGGPPMGEGGDSLLGWPRVEQLEQGHRQRPAGHTLYTNTGPHQHTAPYHIFYISKCSTSTCSDDTRTLKACNQQEMTCSRLQTNVNVSTCTGGCREGDGCIARANRNFKQKILFEVVTFTWITMHLDSLDCDADQEQRRGAYCSVLSRVTCHVTRHT